MDFPVPAEAIGAAAAIAGVIIGFAIGRYERRYPRNVSPPVIHDRSISHQHEWGTHLQGDTFWRCTICGAKGPEIPGATVN